MSRLWDSATAARFNAEAEAHSRKAALLKQELGRNHPKYLAEVRAVKQLRRLAKRPPKE